MKAPLTHSQRRALVLAFEAQTERTVPLGIHRGQAEASAWYERMQKERPWETRN